MALKSIVRPEIYKHFLLLHSSIYILLSSNADVQKWNTKAQNMLEKFVVNMKVIYGSKSVVYNVHNLLHISDDAKNYGSLDNISAFPYENKLQFLKKQVRGKKLQLEQIVNRIIEGDNIPLVDSKKITKPTLVVKNVLRRYFLDSFSVSAKMGDNCFITKSDSIILVVSLYFSDNKEIRLLCKKLQHLKCLPDYPIRSSDLCAFKIVTNSNAESIIYKPSDLKMKCVCLPLPENSSSFFCIPML